MADGSVPTAGALGSLTVTEVIAALTRAHRAGLLRFGGTDQRLVAFADGGIYLATTASGPSIHQILVGSGAVPEEAWAEANGAGPDRGGIVAVLDADERVDKERLVAVLREHAVATLAELLAPGTDTYELLDGQVHQLGAHHRFPVDDLLDDAAQRLATWRSVSSLLPSTATVVRRTPTLPAGALTATFSAVEWQVLAAIPTDATVADVIAASGLSAFTVFDVLHRLVRRGLVQPVPEAAPPS